MPKQDAQGRWISDDGLQYWDGNAWRPIGVAPQPRRGMSALPAVLIGCGFALVIAIVVVIGFTVALFNSPDMQRAFCNGFNGGGGNVACPFQPSS